MPADELLAGRHVAHLVAAPQLYQALLLYSRIQNINTVPLCKRPPNYVCRTCTYKRCEQCCGSGSALIWQSWIRIRIWNADPDLGAWKLIKIKKTNLAYCLSKRLMYLRTYVFWPVTYFKHIYAKTQLFVTLKSDHDQDLHWFSSLDPDLDPHWDKKRASDPDPHWNQCGSINTGCGYLDHYVVFKRYGTGTG